MTTIVPTEQAQHVAQMLTEATDVQRQILEETLASAENGDVQESGRTLCPHSSDFEHGPLARYDTAVDLSSCPVGATGIMHSHVSRDQIRNPTHSLPDMANVVFGPADASMVAGVDSGDLMMAPADEAAAQQAFIEALGVDATSPRDVVSALDGGTIQNPSAVRDDVRGELSGLFRKPRTRFGDLRNRVNAAPASATTMTASACVSMVWESQGGGDATSRFRRRCNHASKGTQSILAQTTEGIDLRQLIVASIIGDLVGSGIDATWRRLNQP